MTFRLSTSARHAMLAAVGGLVDVGGKRGTLSLFAGAQPGSPEDRPNGSTLLARIRFNSPGFGKPSEGSVTAIFDTGDLAVDSGRCSWARVADDDGRGVIDCDVGDEDSDASIKLNTVEIRKGGPVVIRSFTLEV